MVLHHPSLLFSPTWWSLIGPHHLLWFLNGSKLLGTLGLCACYSLHWNTLFLSLYLDKSSSSSRYTAGEIQLFVLTSLYTSLQIGKRLPEKLPYTTNFPGLLQFRPMFLDPMSAPSGTSGHLRPSCTHDPGWDRPSVWGSSQETSTYSPSQHSCNMLMVDLPIG
jgi:hypothetical protein